MYAIVEIAGQQFKVEAGQNIFVHRLQGKQGDKIDFSDIYLKADGDNISVGTPIVAKSKVSATIIEHLKGDKVIVFKKKRRKGYKTQNGHRQYLTKISIDSIS